MECFFRKANAMGLWDRYKLIAVCVSKKQVGLIKRACRKKFKPICQRLDVCWSLAFPFYYWYSHDAVLLKLNNSSANGRETNTTLAPH
jgi:hypothetical protein